MTALVVAGAGHWLLPDQAIGCLGGHWLLGGYWRQAARLALVLDDVTGEACQKI